MLLTDPKTGKLGPVHDFGEPIYLDLMDYKSALANEQLCPDRITMGNKYISLGRSESAIIKILGDKYTCTQNPLQLQPEKVDAFCYAILKEQPNTMHFYKLLELKEQVTNMWVKTYEWDVHEIGKILATFTSPRQNGKYKVQLIRLRLLRDSKRINSVKWISNNTLERNDTVHVLWNIARDRVKILGTVHL
ncbi:MAG: hypothetical protein C0417_05395 [Chlorobiaceae bacterium]|nr:hypothetical protein [Chlorobiaceae bacterium]